MKPEKLFLPLMVGAAVIGIYLLFRNTNSQSQALTVPNPSSSGVTQAASSGGVVQPVTYNVPATSISPDPIVVLSDPSNPNPSSTPTTQPPAYLAFNFPPASNLSQTAATPATSESGGCKSSCNQCSKKSSCNQANGFVDGSVSSPLASSTARLVKNGGDTWIENTRNNINAYLSLEGQPTI